MKPIPATEKILSVVPRIIWFEPAEKALSDPVRFMAYAMTYARHEDMKSIREHVSDEDFREALDRAPAGIIDPRSWAYWNSKTSELARLATKVYGLSAVALPLPRDETNAEVADDSRLARRLSGLGYPGFSHLRAERANPAATIFLSLVQKDLEVRLTEALPWVLATYPDLDWSWLTDKVKLADVQNRLGFLVGLAAEVASTHEKFRPALEPLQQAETRLERARLAREDTLCRESMTGAERRWLSNNRSPLARHWNLLTGLTVDQLPYAN